MGLFGDREKGSLVGPHQRLQRRVVARDTSGVHGDSHGGSPIAVDHDGVREKAAAGHPGRQSERYHCPPDDFSRPKQIDVLVDLIERDRLDRVADLPLCSKGHDLAQVGVAAPERAVEGLFARNSREQRDIDAVPDQSNIDIVTAD